MLLDKNHGLDRRGLKRKAAEAIDGLDTVAEEEVLATQRSNRLGFRNQRDRVAT